MLRNYLKIAIRSLTRTKLYSFINITGLSVSVACCLLLALYIQDEVGYDEHHERLSDLYRIDTKFEGAVGFDKLASVSPPIPMTLKEELPQIEAAARLVPAFSESLIQYEDKKFYESKSYTADSTIFDVLTYEFKEGNPKKSLTDANTVVISETLSHKLFGDASALDKSIQISQGANPINYKITGVYKRKKSFLDVEFFTSIMSEGGVGEYIRSNPEAANEWAGQNFVSAFIKLSPGQSKELIEKEINDVLVKYGAEDMKALGINKTLFVEPVKDIYLKSQVDKNQRISYLYIIASIGGFILLLACINFMNLSTAKATKRASEMGIRKVMGAFRGSLMRQILGEAMIIVAISMLVSVIIVAMSLSAFNELSGKDISFSQDNVLYFGVALLLLTIVTGLMAGSYPAFYMSSFQPVEVLKGKFTLGNTSGKLRQILVVFQFTVAIVLVCGMLVISRQLSFMKEKDLGFDPEAKIIIPLRTGEAKQKYESLKSVLETMSSINSVSAANVPPGLPIFNDMAFYLEGGNMDNAILNRRNSIDAGYMDLLGIELIAGRPFTDNRKADSQGQLIINRASAKKFGLEPDRMIGQKLYFDWQGQNYSFQVIGVMEDYNQTSLKDPIVPIVFEIPQQADGYNFMIASINPSEFSNTISLLEEKWKQQVSDAPFEYTFLDDNIQQQYNEDQRVSKIITYFAVIAMIVCSLGLYGLSSFMAERRLKEIGVRKVMGASVTQIMAMMSKEFVKLVLLAIVIATPFSWYAMNKWLQNFEYQTQLHFSIFTYAGLCAIAIALITISYESLKAANTNPAQTLRNE